MMVAKCYDLDGPRPLRVLTSEHTYEIEDLGRLVEAPADAVPDDTFVTLLRENVDCFADADHVSVQLARVWAQRGLNANNIMFPPVDLTTGSVGPDAIRKILADEHSAQLNAILHVVPWVEDGAGLVCRQYSVECRTVRMGYMRELLAKQRSGPTYHDGHTFSDIFELGTYGIQLKSEPSPFSFNSVMVLADAVILHQPRSARLLEQKSYGMAMSAAQREQTMFSQRIFRLARERSEADRAFDAFAYLFTYYSNNEELWRLKSWMKDLLPFGLEEHPGVEHFRKLLDKQVGHIDNLTKFYAEDSPSHVADENYVRTAHFKLAPRYRWLIEECRKRGFKRVAELGSVDGISLFPLMQVAPDIEWHGFEVSAEAVKHGNELAKTMGLEDRFHLHHVESFDRGGVFERRHSVGPFDAAFVSEVLEHNSPAEGHIILDAAEFLAGHIFISTPNGNWSICDEKTRDLELRKDHINAYTKKRMERFLSGRGASQLEVITEENPDFWEANSWVFANYKVME